LAVNQKDVTPFAVLKSSCRMRNPGCGSNWKANASATITSLSHNRWMRCFED
jgi:hypothetical protein